jgi:hypothetical protein
MFIRSSHDNFKGNIPLIKSIKVNLLLSILNEKSRRLFVFLS